MIRYMDKSIRLHLLFTEFNKAMGLFFEVCLDLLAVVKGNLNASAYKDIFDNSALPNLWKEVGKDPFLFQHNYSQKNKARSINVWLDNFWCGRS